MPVVVGAVVVVDEVWAVADVDGVDGVDGVDEVDGVDGVDGLLDTVGVPVGIDEPLLPDPLPTPPVMVGVEVETLLLGVIEFVEAVEVETETLLLLVLEELTGGLIGALIFSTKVVRTKLFPSGSQAIGTATDACIALAHPKELYP